MRLIEVEKSEIKKKIVKTELYKLLDEFTTGGYACAKIEGALEHYASKNSAQSTIQHAIKYYKFGGIKCSAVGEDVYLLKKEI